MRKLFACTTIVAALGATGCPDVKVDPGEGPGEFVTGPTVEFDPASSIIPFPNNLILDPATGKVNAPAGCNEGASQTALRTGVINKLDGFGTFEVGLQATFTTTPDTDTLSASTIVLYKRADAGVEVDAATAQPVPAQIFLAKFPRLASDCMTVSMVDTVTIVPAVPLDQHSTYDVALLSGIKDAGTGADYLPSVTWSLVRQNTDPVTLDAAGNIIAEQTPFDPNNQIDVLKLKGIDRLWKAHAPALAFLDKLGHTDRSKILLAWEFNTQTTSDPLDAHIATSPAGSVSTDGFAGVASALATLCGGPCTAQQFLEGSPIGPACNDHAGGYIPCDKVGDILGGVMLETLYQQDQPNAFDATKPIPGQWNDPIHPTAVHATAPIKLIAMVPSTPAPAGGYPTVIFGHGLGSRKETLIAIGPQLAALGFASVAIDFVDHGDRAVQITNDAALGCDGAALDASESPQCFAPFLSADLGADRDNFRQSVVDLHRLHAALLACAGDTPPATCGALHVNPAKIEYLGISLGGILGSTFVSTADLKAAALNVPGVGWLDIIENTASLDIACTVVDALIGAGILVGDKSSGATLTTPPTAGLCTTPAWKAQPAYVAFSGAARWILDPADGANFKTKLAAQKILIQEVVDDEVVPNVATDHEGALVGLAPGTADAFTGTEGASVAISASPLTNHWVRYPTLPAAGPFPGNSYHHASLLKPASADAAGVLGTVRLETDALTFLFANAQ